MIEPFVTGSTWDDSRGLISVVQF